MLKPCVVGCAKSFLVVYNCLFFLTGITMVICGIWLHIDRDMMTYLRIAQVTPSGDLLSNLSHALIGVGMSLSLLAFFGCFGACCENVCMLLSYISFLFVILTAETIGAVLVGVFKREVMLSIESNMYKQVREQYNRTSNSTHDITMAWDFMQVRLECCGAKGPQDYSYSYWFNKTKDQGTFVPATCCVLLNDDPVNPVFKLENQCQIDGILYPRDIVVSDAVRTKGCHTALMDWLHEKGLYLIMITGGMGLLQVMGFLFACCLFARIRAEQTRYPWYDMVSE